MIDAKVIWRLRRPIPDEFLPSLTFTLQALLARHEAYMESAERDRRDLTAHIEKLERDNAELESQNTSATSENHVLQQDLDQLNDTIKDAEAKIERLEAMLLNSQREVRRLEKAEARADILERDVARLEEEQDRLRTTIAQTEEEARTVMGRWRTAQKELVDLQAQIEDMEKEAKEERERHVETVARMERQRAMEKELDTAAGRLKGAAGAKWMTERRNGGDVVFQLVRDLMEDNTNFQLNIAELCDSLRNANDEIQMLRDQLIYHQPAADQESGPLKTLQAELEKKEPPSPPTPQVQQQLHIHHHYHVTQKPDARKTKRKKITPGGKGKGVRVVSNPVRGSDGATSDEGRGDSNKASSALGKLAAWRPWAGNNNKESRKPTEAATPEASESSTPILSPSAAAAAPTKIPALALPSVITSTTTATATTVLSKSPQGSISSTSTATTGATTALTAPTSLSSTPMFRAPGINQPGTIPGFQEYFAAHKRRPVPTKVAVAGGERERVGEALREVLEEM
ncbi:hypothetical protein N0V88_004904 [Collariella sp. IMI 366227]|nr:hypothetical protein N0V88_004904 [Collariella sp. IMI 366227]